MISEALAAIADREVLARIGGPIGDAARAAQQDLARLDAKAAKARRATWLAAARTPVPPGIRGIDRTWIEAALARITDEVEGVGAGADKRASVFREHLASLARCAIADSPTTPVEVWLARWVCAGFPPMPPIESIDRPQSVAEAVRMSGAMLRAWLEEVGADQLAFALGAKTAGAISPRIAAAAARIALPPREGELGDRRVAIERARISLDDTALVRIGARAIAAHASSLERLQLAHRLPRELGILGELEAFAGSGGPSWRALGAA